MLVKIAVVVNKARKFLESTVNTDGLMESALGKAEGLAALAPWHKFTGGVGGAAAASLDAALGANLHDLASVASAKSNKLGRAFQTAALSDVIVAAKQATEGKVFANRRLAPMWLYVSNPAKAMAIAESSAAFQAMPEALGKKLFDGNKMKTGYLKGALSGAHKADNILAAAQVSAPLYFGNHAYQSERAKGASHDEAMKAATTHAAVGGLVTTSLMIPRKMLSRPMAKAHKALSKDGDYGYKLLESAAERAEASMNRGTHRLFYSTPEENLKAPIGKITGGALRKLFGQEAPVKWDKKHGYMTQSDIDEVQKAGIKTGLAKFVQTTSNTLAGEF